MKIIGGESQSINLDEFLARPLFAHLATVSEDGARDTPVWFLWEEGAIWIIAVVSENTFHERIECDPRCAVGILDFAIESGMVQHASFRGKATVEPWDEDRAKKLLSKYLGEDWTKWDSARFVDGLDDSSLWRFVRFTPETATIRDQSYPPSPR